MKLSLKRISIHLGKKKEEEERRLRIQNILYFGTKFEFWPLYFRMQGPSSIWV